MKKITVYRSQIAGAEVFHIHIEGLPGLIQIEQKQDVLLATDGVLFIDLITGQISGRVRRNNKKEDAV